ncbi:MAG: pyruvate synthase [bacterium]|nr:pyruvate synthase [bacterium]
MIPVIKKPGSTRNTKTGGWRALKPVRDTKKCTKCMTCWMNCPDNAIAKDLRINYDYCKGCGICAATCPVKAIEMKKEEK